MIFGFISLGSNMNNQAGKGSKLRKGANLRAYWEADYWKFLEKRKSKLTTKIEQISEGSVESDKKKANS